MIPYSPKQIEQIKKARQEKLNELVGSQTSSPKRRQQMTPTQKIGHKITIRRLESGYQIAFTGNIVGNIYFPSVKELEFLIKEFKRVINMIKGAEGI